MVFSHIVYASNLVLFPYLFCEERIFPEKGSMCYHGNCDVGQAHRQIIIRGFCPFPIEFPFLVLVMFPYFCVIFEFIIFCWVSTSGFDLNHVLLVVCELVSSFYC